MGVDVIIVTPVDNTGIADACQKAVDEGIPVIGFTSNIETATTNLVSADETMTGEECAQLAIDWLDEAYADAADGSVEAAVLIYSGTKKV
jgi:ABC-type sugar transport system substrate-binding protein